MNRRLSVDPRASRKGADDVTRFHLDVEVGIVQLTVGSSAGILTCAQVIDIMKRNNISSLVILIKKDESLRSSPWCLIRTLHNYPLNVTEIKILMKYHELKTSSVPLIEDSSLLSDQRINKITSI